MKDKINTIHCRIYAVLTANIADVKLGITDVQINTHVFLLLFIATEDTYFLDVQCEESGTVLRYRRNRCSQ